MHQRALKNKQINSLSEVSLTHSESLAMKKLLENGPLSDKELFEEYTYLSEIVKPVLSENLVNVLSNFKSSDNVALLIKGLPIDDLIVSTPKTGYFPNWAIPIAVRAQFSIYGLLNLLPVVYSGENRTKLVRQVVPVASDVANASSHGSETTFGYHVDNPDLPLLSEHSSVTSSCPEYLSLYGVRGDSNVPTIIVSLIDVLNCLTLDDLGILQGPFFSIKRPASFDSNQAVTTDLPLLRFDDANGWLCRLDVENVSTDMVFAQEALDRFINLLNTQNFDQDFILDKGDFLIFKNQKVLHTRRRFRPRFDGQDRWLMRMFGLNSSEQFTPVSADLPYVCQV